MRILTLVLALFMTGCDSGSEGKDDVLRIISSLDLEGITFRYRYAEGEGEVTLCSTASEEGGRCRNTNSPAAETIIDVSYVQDNIFNFWANQENFRENFTQCQVGPIAVQNGAADVIVFSAGNPMQVDCSGNWNPNFPLGSQE
jgi:hypothetical protein